MKNILLSCVTNRPTMWFGVEAPPAPAPPAAKPTVEDRSKNLITAILEGKLHDDPNQLEKDISGEKKVEPPASDPKKEGDPPVEDKKDDITLEDPFATPEPPKAGDPPVEPEPVGAEGHKRAMQTLRDQVTKANEGKTTAEAALSDANNRLKAAEAELERLKANPGAPVFQPLSKEDAIKDPNVVKHLDALSSTVNNMLGDVSEPTAALLEPDISRWMDRAKDVETDPSKRRAFVAELEQEFPTEDGRSLANHLIKAAGLSKEVEAAAAALMAEPAKNGMRKARQDWEGRKTELSTTLASRLKVEGTKLAENPYHPLTFIASQVAGDDKWKADSARVMEETLAIFTGVEPLAESDLAAFTGAFDDSAGKEITARRDKHSKMLPSAVVQMYAVKMLAPLLGPALEALMEKREAAEKIEAERRAAGGGPAVPPTAKEEPKEKKFTSPLDILRDQGLYGQ